MKKVVSFLESYAEWVALTLAVLFLLYTVYANVVSPEPLKTTVVGSPQPLLPDAVDPYVQQSVKRLQAAIEAPAGKEDLFPVREFRKDFETAMGPKRLR